MHLRSVLLELLSHFWAPIPWMIEVALALTEATARWADFAIALVLVGLAWAYALAWMLLLDQAKLWAYAALDRRASRRAVPEGCPRCTARL